ncbi:MAG: hypothetical protein F4Z15_03990 [Gammaproteobacteria bacterium]|nr:hypothetical protein [Gammaproteobacteria bacterium]MYD76114.1 hypothetical protein [Gammaproteobacteria bacterium]
MGTIPTNPFDKYLYSGAFYIQAADCYRLVLQWLEHGNPEADGAILGSISEIWMRSTLLSYSVALTGAGLSGEGADSKLETRMAELQSIVAGFGPGIVSEVLSQVSAQPGGPPSLQEFFEIWTAACAKAHAELLNSDTVIDSVTGMMNRFIHHACEMSGPAGAEA